MFVKHDWKKHDDMFRLRQNLSTYIFATKLEDQLDDKTYQLKLKQVPGGHEYPQPAPSLSVCHTDRLSELCHSSIKKTFKK